MGKKRSSKKPLIISLIIALVLIAILAAMFFGGNGKHINVLVSNVELRTITQTVSAVGKIEPETEVKISSQTSGEVIFLGVKEGDTVKLKQLLARINPDIVETQLEQVRASVESAKIDVDARLAEKERASNDFERAKELYAKKFISKQEFDMSKSAYETAFASHKAAISRVEQAKATLRQYERSIARTSIFSPISGIVTALSVELGEKVVGTEMMMGTEMMRVSDLSIMNAVVDVDENDIVLVKKGDTTLIEIDAIPDKIFKGKVIEIGHSAKTSSLGTQDQVTNFSVKVRLLEQDPRLRPGMSCNVEIQTASHYNVPSVPLQAVTVRETKPFGDEQHKADESDDNGKKEFGAKRPPSVVFTIENGTAKMVTVETGISDKGFIEIVSGLKQGQKIISGSYQAVSKLLSDGAKVRVDSLKAPKK